MKNKLTSGALILSALTAATLANAALTPVDLRCDYGINPMGVDSQNPRLFWQVTGGGRGEMQSAYQALVADSAEALAKGNGDVWDSGRVDSDETIQVPCPSDKLKSFEQVFWKVRVWDENGKASDWSKTAMWTMGILATNDWQAQWIGAADTNIPSILLRHEFTVKPGLRRALVNVCGLGEYEMTINGKKVGDEYLSPGWTKYTKTCLYNTYDITKAVGKGANAVGIELGNGMYNVIGGGRFTKFKGSYGPQKAIAQLRFEYDDGSVETVGTDGSWRVAPGPITFSSIYGGEDFDARLVQAGWDKTHFDDSKWSPAQVDNGPGGVLRGMSCSAPAIHTFEVQRPIGSRTLTNGDIVYDLGQNASHVPRIVVTGPAGSTIKIMPSELTSADGAANQGSMGGGRRGFISCEYTKGTDGTETWSPKFFYVGCRYLEVKLSPPAGQSNAPAVKSIVGVVIQSSSAPVGDFACSNPLFNRIRTLVRWAQRSNMQSILTDCPHRERLGWLEQDHLNGPSLRYEFDLAQLYTKIINDIADSQLTNGLVPTTAPEYTIFRVAGDHDHLRDAFGDSPEWSATFIISPWQQYEFDGDLNLFRLHYDAMKDYLNYFGTRADNYIASYGLGDWYDLGPKKPGVSQLTPIPLTATAFYYQDAEIMAQAAALLGKTDDAKMYTDLADHIRTAFNHKFYNADTKSYATGSQCANAIPLVMGLCEPENRAAVVDAIVRDVRARGNGLTAGDVGYRYLLRALADGGRSDVIFDINNQSDKPGYGMQLKKGKTSLTEAWDGGASQDHFMLGQIEEWFYHDLAGIRSDDDGFKRISIDPQPCGDITWAKASYDSIRGRIVSDWKRDGDQFTLKVTIPANTTAEVYVPAKSAADVTEKVAIRSTESSRTVKFLREEDGRAVCEIGSGRYEFKSVAGR